MNALSPDQDQETLNEGVFETLFSKIDHMEGDDSIISGVQNEIIACINTMRAKLGKDPLDLGALETVHLKIGEGNNVYEPEFDKVVGVLEATGEGSDQVFKLTDPDALEASILKKVEK